MSQEAKKNKSKFQMLLSANAWCDQAIILQATMPSIYRWGIPNLGEVIPGTKKLAVPKIESQPQDFEGWVAWQKHAHWLVTMALELVLKAAHQHAHPRGHSYQALYDGATSETKAKLEEQYHPPDDEGHVAVGEIFVTTNPQIEPEDIPQGEGYLHSFAELVTYAHKRWRSVDLRYWWEPGKGGPWYMLTDVTCVAKGLQRCVSRLLAEHPGVVIHEAPKTTDNNVIPFPTNKRHKRENTMKPHGEVQPQITWDDGKKTWEVLLPTTDRKEALVRAKWKPSIVYGIKCVPKEPESTLDERLSNAIEVVTPMNTLNFGNVHEALVLELTSISTEDPNQRSEPNRAEFQPKKE